jgi:hypothetical protein
MLWLKRRKLEHLFEQLKKIAANDREYHARTDLSEQDHHDYIIRQSRRHDILQRIAEINEKQQRKKGQFSF